MLGGQSAVLDASPALVILVSDRAPERGRLVYRALGKAVSGPYIPVSQARGPFV